MDWKYKQFYSERVFQAPRVQVFEAARAFAADSLCWQVLDTAEGFEAKGFSFSHMATAKFHVVAASGGTKVDVELLVERAGPMGFMLVDLGGYYSGQIRKWFEGIQWALHSKLASSMAPDPVAGESEAVPVGNTSMAGPTDWKNRPNAGFNRIFTAILILWVIILVAYFFVLPAIGLLTGSLYLPGRGGAAAPYMASGPGYYRRRF